MTVNTLEKSFKTYRFVGMAIDPIHVGTGGCRLGRVDNTIVRDPVTQIPKIPGSSLAGVMRAYVAMANDKYPGCAGQGQTDKDGGGENHCGKSDCPVCAVFGFAKGKDNTGGFAGLAGFSDMQILLFSVASQMGPQWITCPMALRQLDNNIGDVPEQDAIYRQSDGQPINLGWLLLPVKAWDKFNDAVSKVTDCKLPEGITQKIGIVSDKLFTHLVNSNLEVRTSVAIDPATGAAKEGALFSYEAMPRGTVLTWDIICRNPKHFRINKSNVEAVKSPDAVKSVITNADSYLEHLGIGGMGTRGMGRLRVLNSQEVQK